MKVVRVLFRAVAAVLLTLFLFVFLTLETALNAAINLAHEVKEFRARIAADLLP